jgi:hypothetical protein
VIVDAASTFFTVARGTPFLHSPLREKKSQGVPLSEPAYRGNVRTVGDGILVSDRRLSYDRRNLTWRTFVQGGLTPRRRGARRDAEHHGLVDWHEAHLLFLAIAILLLSVTDALLTLTLMKHGAQEANPMLAFLIGSYPRLFAVAKMALTGAGVLVLVVLARARVFRVIKVSTLMHWCLLGYVVLITYEWWLLQQTL